MRRVACALLALSALVAAPVGATTVRAGIDAWQRGDYPRAVATWRTLAEKGDADAAFNLGQAYRLGRGVNSDSAAAKRWFEKAARAGHLDAQVSLGLLLFDSGDRPTAFEWLGKAAERGEPRALLVTGTALFNGDGLPRDAVRGYAYVSRSAAQGLMPAKQTLADMDRIMPIDDRRKGVALAIALADGKPAVAKPPSPKVAAAAPPAKPAVRPGAATNPVAAPDSRPPKVAAGGNWRIQLGAFSARGSAQALFGKLSGKLGGAQAYYIPVGTMTRLQAGPFASKAAADAACARLRPQACFAVSAR
jgi:TPR repeat protein